MASFFVGDFEGGRIWVLVGMMMMMVESFCSQSI